MLLEVSDAMDLLHCVLIPQDLDLTPNGSFEFGAQLTDGQLLVESQKGGEITVRLNSFHCMQYPGQVSRLFSGICQGLDWKLKNDCICMCNESMLDERWSFLFINKALMIAKRAPLEKPIQHDELGSA